MKHVSEQVLSYVSIPRTPAKSRLSPYLFGFKTHAGLRDNNDVYSCLLNGLLFFLAYESCPVGVTRSRLQESLTELPEKVRPTLYTAPGINHDGIRLVYCVILCTNMELELKTRSESLNFRTMIRSLEQGMRTRDRAMTGQSTLVYEPSSLIRDTELEMR